jgi:GT2 family glycosyltransferase
MGTMRIIVVTASLPERETFRAEAAASVAAQTLQPITHLVAIDHERAGPARILNRLLPACIAAGAEWIAQLADDDLLDPHHLATLATAAATADIIYPYCRVTGRNWNPNAPFDADRLRRENYIPATTIIRTSLCETLNGWREDAAHGFEDWDFWVRALDAGARFACIPQVTWTYRFHGQNLSQPLR